MASGDVKAQYEKAIEDFKRACGLMLANTKVAMDELEKTGNTNFDSMAQTYINGCKEMKSQVLKGNQQMLEKFKENYNQVQQGLDDAYANLKGENMGAFGTNVSKFSENISSLLSKIPGLKDSAVGKGAAEVGAFCKEKQKETLQAAESKLKEVTKVLKDNWEDSTKKLKMKEEDLNAKKANKK